ncbi:methyltransferase domain-containing protein [Paracoccaceae bacterium]|nr:methyltransferase domain-containing protein [Paracoccaceae bacterium]
MAKSYLNDVYDGGTNDSRELYASWASTYDNEVQKNGYVTPERVAKALKDIVTNQSEVILDYGCGTGLSGFALQAVGFTNIDGLDVSQEMITLAEKKSIYKKLTVFDPSTKIPVHADQYKIITAIGVIGAGAAPLEVFDNLFSLLPPSGLFAFSFNDHTLSDLNYEEKVNQCLSSGQAIILHKSYGNHLPKANLKSNIYILKKL